VFRSGNVSLSDSIHDEEDERDKGYIGSALNWVWVWIDRWVAI
jgi:hypothetical protein